MAQWQAVQSSQTIRALYGIHFPLEVRHYFAEWIEAQPWVHIDADDPSMIVVAQQLLEQLLSTIDTRLQELTTLQTGDSFLMQLRLQEILGNIRLMYSSDPLRLVRVVKDCLLREQSELQGPSAIETTPVSTQSSVSMNLPAALQQLAWQAQDATKALAALNQSQESLVILFQESMQFDATNQHLLSLANEHGKFAQAQKQQYEAQITTKSSQMLQDRMALFERLMANLGSLQSLSKVLLNEHLRELQQQQMQGGEAQQMFRSQIAIIQQCAESLADTIWTTRQQVRTAAVIQSQLPLPSETSFQDLSSLLNVLLAELVHRTFLVDEQPPRVLKTNSKFEASARFLVGPKLNVHMDLPAVSAVLHTPKHLLTTIHVEVTIVNEEQAAAIAAENDASVQGVRSRRPIDVSGCGELVNNKKVMTFETPTRTLSAQFKNMSLKKIKRGDTKGDLAVTEEKFALCFTSTFNIGGEFTFTVRRLSLPVVVIVHGNQQPDAEATILWDSSFADVERMPFVVPDTVSVGQLAQMLDHFFASVTNAHLTDEQAQYVSSKVIPPDFDGQWDQAQMLPVSWQNFNKNDLPGRDFTMWQWFYAAADLIHKHFLGPWIDGSIVGFANKAQAQLMLQDAQPGTFLLRFSDSEIGGITVAWVGVEDGLKQVWNLQPWFAKDFAIRSLSDRIKDLGELQYLYPDIPKMQAFGKYTTFDKPATTLHKDYVKVGIAAVIEH